MNAYEWSKEKSKAKKNHDLIKANRLSTEIDNFSRDIKQFQSDLEHMQSPFGLTSEAILEKYEKEIYSRDHKENKDYYDD